MLVNLYNFKGLKEKESFETSFTDIREIINAIGMCYGTEIAEDMIVSKYTYVSKVNDSIISLDKDSLATDLLLYDNLHIFATIEGNVPAAFFFALLEGITQAAAVETLAATAIGELTTTMIASYALSAIASVVISTGISMAVSAIMSPDTSVKSGAVDQPKSNLFNNALISSNQGCSVPLVYGTPYCGGVLISSGLTTTQTLNITGERLLAVEVGFFGSIGKILGT